MYLSQPVEKPESDFLFLPNLYQMGDMFNNAHAFNGAVPFDTSKVTNVSVYLCRVQLEEIPDSDL